MQLLALFEKQPCSVEEFCTSNNISKVTFHKWRSRYAATHRTNNAFGGFATFHYEANSDTPMLFAEVNGIRIYQPVAASFLKDLLVV